MSSQAILTNLLLPPLLFVVALLPAAILAWRGRRQAGTAVAICALGLLLLSTPFAAATLTVSLEGMLDVRRAEDTPAPAAIIVLGGEMTRGVEGPDIGPLTLERLRAAVVLHRRTGLPLLVTGGPLSQGAPPIAAMMADSLAADFGVTPRWIEPRARDTRENAAFSSDMLRREGIGAAFVVSHAWHLPRGMEAFDRAGLPARPAPVRRGRMPSGIASDWLPRPDHLAQSWFALREWAGLLVYRFRDG